MHFHRARQRRATRHTAGRQNEEPHLGGNREKPDGTHLLRSPEGQLLKPDPNPTPDRCPDLVEQLRSTIEELQAANEQLENANEELQTAHEQLHLSYREIQDQRAELLRANNDIFNLPRATNIPVVMIGNDLRIRRFTPTAKKILELMPGDVGRPVGDLKNRIDAPDLENLLRRVIETLLPDEQEVRDLEGRRYLMRVRPYLTTDYRIEGPCCSWWTSPI